MMEGSSRKLELLQAGRAIASIGVVMCHAGIYAGHRLGSEYYGIGVDFFFLLSGYIIYHVTAGREFSLRRFAGKRARRIYLPYWPVGVAMIVLYAVQGKDFSLLASLTLLPGETALHPAWSLQNEVAFYALAATGFWIGRPLLVMAAWAAVIALFGVADTEKSNLAEMALNTRNLAFVLGMFLAAFVRIPDVRVGPALNLLGDASYSIYLAHLPVMGVAWRLGADFWTLALCGVAAGLAYYRFVEKPLLVSGRPRLELQSPAPVAARGPRSKALPPAQTGRISATNSP